MPGGWRSLRRAQPGAVIHGPTTTLICKPSLRGAWELKPLTRKNRLTD